MGSLANAGNMVDGHALESIGDEMANTIEIQGQRLTPKGEATRERIVAAAANLMNERGFAGTSTEDVKSAAGVSSSQVYHYFSDKKSLLRAVIAYQTDLVLGVQEPFLAKLDSIEALEAWRDFMVDYQNQRHCVGGCPMGSLAAELVERDADARADFVVGFDRWVAGIRDGLQSMQEHGHLHADVDIERLAQAFLAAIQGGLFLSQTNRNTIALKAALDELIDRVRFSFIP